MLVKNLSVKCKQPKKDSFHRYYVKNIDSIEIVKKKDIVIKKTNEKEALKQDVPNRFAYRFRSFSKLFSMCLIRFRNYFFFDCHW